MRTTAIARFLLRLSEDILSCNRNSRPAPFILFLNTRDRLRIQVLALFWPKGDPTYIRTMVMCHRPMRHPTYELKP